MLSRAVVHGKAEPVELVEPIKPGHGHGTWQEPGNFNHYLSALTWTVQLIIFNYICFQEQDDEAQIPVFLAKVCKQFFQ